MKIFHQKWMASRNSVLTFSAWKSTKKICQNFQLNLTSFFFFSLRLPCRWLHWKSMWRQQWAMYLQGRSDWLDLQPLCEGLPTESLPCCAVRQWVSEFSRFLVCFSSTNWLRCPLTEPHVISINRPQNTAPETYYSDMTDVKPKSREGENLWRIFRTIFF